MITTDNGDGVIVPQTCFVRDLKLINRDNTYWITIFNEYLTIQYTYLNYLANEVIIISIHYFRYTESTENTLNEH